ncbi:MAG TPA: hypothetical protein VHW73_02675 [Rudaea sp.]|jgi:hypothetical protein|nr:hypothetical protein [Rudaea sp.]
MKRYVYAFDTSTAAMSAVEYLGANGIDGQNVSLVARGDINKNELPDSLLNVSMDFTPSVKRGAAYGAATGLVIGIVVSFIPVLGISISAFELIAFLIGGALIGMWSASMIGASVPNKLRRKFTNEIEAGHTLVVIDSDGSNDAQIIGGMSKASDRHLVWQSDSTRMPEVAA